MSICTQHGTHARLITRFLPICTEFPAEPNMSMGPLEHARILLSPVMSEFQSRVRAALDILFASLHLQPTTDLDVALAVVLLTSVTTLILYYFACGRRHRRTRKHLNRQLADLRQEVRSFLLSSCSCFFPLPPCPPDVLHSPSNLCWTE